MSNGFSDPIQIFLLQPMNCFMDYNFSFHNVPTQKQCSMHGTNHLLSYFCQSISDNFYEKIETNTQQTYWFVLLDLFHFTSLWKQNDCSKIQHKQRKNAHVKKTSNRAKPLRLKFRRLRRTLEANHMDSKQYYSSFGIQHPQALLLKNFGSTSHSFSWTYDQNISPTTRLLVTLVGHPIHGWFL